MPRVILQKDSFILLQQYCVNIFMSTVNQMVINSLKQNPKRDNLTQHDYLNMKLLSYFQLVVLVFSRFIVLIQSGSKVVALLSFFVDQLIIGQCKD